MAVNPSNGESKMMLAILALAILAACETAAAIRATLAYYLRSDDEQAAYLLAQLEEEESY